MLTRLPCRQALLPGAAASPRRCRVGRPLFLRVRAVAKGGGGGGGDEEYGELAELAREVLRDPQAAAQVPQALSRGLPFFIAPLNPSPSSPRFIPRLMYE